MLHFDAVFLVSFFKLIFWDNHFISFFIQTERVVRRSNEDKQQGEKGRGHSSTMVVHSIL